MHWRKAVRIKGNEKVYLLRSETMLVIINGQKSESERAEGENMDELMIKKFRESCDYNIVLIGFMGAGKSTVARTLGEWFDMDIVEMDELISDRQRMSIPEIFEKYGEEYFRNLETNLLIELQKTSRTIISCGGGAAMRSQNVSEMKKNGYVVLLTADAKTILERVKENDDRPLLKNHKNVEYIAELMEKRREKYETAADLIVQTDKKNVQEICKEMITKLMEMDSRDV